VVLAVLVVLGVARAGEPPAPVLVEGGATLATAAVWSGTVEIAGPVTLGPEGVLTLRPGTTVLFREGAGLSVAGTLLAEGTAAEPIRFLPAGDAVTAGAWEGLTFSNADTPSLLRNCRVAGARTITLAGGAHRIAACEIDTAAQGLTVTGRASRPVLEGNRLHDITGNGIDCSYGSSPVVTGNRIERCGKAGIAAVQGSAPQIIGNTVTACESGIDFNRSAPMIRGNTLRGNQRGIALNLVTGGKPIQDNLVTDNVVGILAENFSAPVLLHNTVEGNGDGIVCYQSSSPLIRLNRVAANTTGISCVQLSSPRIVRNAIEGNDKGVFLHLSSYATIRENDFSGNAIHLGLGVMSADWERRAGRKLPRGRTRQALGQARELGERSSPPAAGDEEVLMDYVDATNNWWGPETTREMAEKGPDANIAGIEDYYDAPTHPSEGYEGVFEQDHVRYAPWATAPLAAGDGERPGRTEAPPAGP
jgi:parallel beta-helix repeat protein